MFVGSRTLATRLDTAPDAETILKYAQDALTRPSDSYWQDDSLWETHTLAFSSAPDSDDTVAQSNYRTILEDLGSAYSRCPDAVEASGFGHWTYSHYDAIRIRVTYANGEIHPAFADAVAIAEALKGYPLYSDEDHSNLEWDLWEKYLEDEIGYRFDSEYRSDNLSEISDEDWTLFLSDIREGISEKFGYYGEAYASDEDWSDAVDSATARIGSVRPDETFQPLF